MLPPVLMNSCVSMHIPVGLGGMYSRKSKTRCSEIASETICGPNLPLDISILMQSVFFTVLCCLNLAAVFMPFFDEYLLNKASLSANYGKLQVTCVQLHYGCMPPSVPQISWLACVDEVVAKAMAIAIAIAMLIAAKKKDKLKNGALGVFKLHTP